MKLGRIGIAALPVAAIAVTAAAAAIPLTANAAGTAHAAASQPYAAYDCQNKPEVRPSTFDIFCDGSQSLTGLKWTEWDSSRAVASGADWVDNCTPNCAQGKWSKQNTIVVLWRPTPVRGHKGEFGYSKMTLLYPGTGRTQTMVPPGAY